MNAQESLKDLERRAYRSTFQDGIYDIMFGIIFLIFAWIPILEYLNVSRLIGYAFLIIPILLPFIGKRMITIPRMGLVEFGPKRKTRSRILLYVGLGVVLLTLPLFIIMLAQGISGRMGWLLIAIFAAPIFIIAVFSLDFPRLFIYSAFLLAGVVEAEFLVAYLGEPLNSIIAFGLPGAIILTIGTAMFVEFIRQYPLTKAEANHVG